MSKAVEKANKACPINKGSGIDRVMSMVNRKNGYIQGYMQAEKDFLERAITWLKENGDCYTWYNEFEGESGITEGFIEEFKKAMEE